MRNDASNWEHQNCILAGFQFQSTNHSTVDELEACFEASRGRNNEGLVIKHADSAYKPGKRGKQWLKLKRALVTLDVVVVAAEYGHGKRAGLLSDYTFSVQHQGELLTIGKAYSGITDKELLQLSELFHKISIRDEGFLHVVPPQVVFEVTFDRINRSNRPQVVSLCVFHESKAFVGIKNRKRSIRLKLLRSTI